jgi:hypothetical protein
VRNISQKWTMPIRDRKAALTRFTIQFEEGIPQNLFTIFSGAGRGKPGG